MANASFSGGRLSGDDMCAYAETFAEKFLPNRIRYNTQVHRLHRDEDGWRLDSEDLTDGSRKELRYAKLVLCTGVRLHFIDWSCIPE
jgi:dimethylaniline monooxygenase (N-oxide forming)